MHPMGSFRQNHMPISEQPRTLVIMAKAPKPGVVKTRLVQSLPPEAVAALYGCLLRDTIALAKSLSGIEAVVMCPESDQKDLADFLGNGLTVVAQKGEGLAAGLTSVFRYYAADRRHVIAFNSDSPHLAPSVLYRAFEILATKDIVVGPTNDGGYYLVGAKAAHPSLFEGDGMGTGSALDRLLTRAKMMELSMDFTEPFYDIDVAGDLIQLARELRLAPQRAPRTSAWLGEWKHALDHLHERTGPL
jgi:rSAM/selenodomain-associated transferase 1